MQAARALKTARTPQPGSFAAAAFFWAFCVFCLGPGALSCNFPTTAEWLEPADVPPFSVVEARLPVADATQPQPRDPIIELRFSDYPDPTTLNFPSLRLGPRGQSIQFAISVSLVDKTLALRPRDHLLPDTDYFVFADPEVRSLAGRALEGGEGFQLTFHTGMMLSPAPPVAAPVTLTQLLAAGGGLAGCGRAGCHSAAGGLEPVRGLDFAGTEAAVRAALTSGRRAGPTRLLLVEAGRPEGSYLLRKLLARTSGGFLQIDGEPMPPPAAADMALDPAALRAIETWIRQGAN
jgi:hypothetical protein